MFCSKAHWWLHALMVAAIRGLPAHLPSIADPRVRLLLVSHACSSAMAAKRVNRAGRILQPRWGPHPGSQLQSRVLRQRVHCCFADGVCWGARNRALCYITTGSSSADMCQCPVAYTICIVNHPDQPLNQQPMVKAIKVGL